MNRLRYLVPVVVLAVACATPDQTPDAVESVLPSLETMADSVAFRALQATGGAEAWAATPYLGFRFGADRGEGPVTFRKHMWNRQTDDYRIEYTRGDSTFVVLFNTRSRDGVAYINGERVAESREAGLVERGYSGFINDTYWLLMPAKMLDPGVTRAYVADSSNADRDVVQLTFGDVGLTPGDTYWVHVDRNTGDVTHWCMVLQGNEGGPARHYDWAGHETFETGAGTFRLSTRKPAGTSALLTDEIVLPEDVEDGMFTSGEPMLLR